MDTDTNNTGTDTKGQATTTAKPITVDIESQVTICCCKSPV